ncbi:MAG: Crp/Fnr family transcriptional regulator [Acidimicrobiales bacterium]
MPSLFDYPSGDQQPAEEANFLRHGSDDDWATLIKHTHNRRFRAGETVMAPGEADRALYIVTDGTLEAVLPGRKGAYRRLSTFDPGSVIGELAFFDGQPRSALVRALTDADLARLSVESFESLAASRPALGRLILFDLGRILAGRLRGAQAPTS